MPSLLLGEPVKFSGYYCKVVEVNNLLNMAKLEFLTGDRQGQTTWVYQFDATPVVQGSDENEGN